MNHTIRSVQSPAFPLSLRRPVAIFNRRDAFSEEFIRVSAYTLGAMLVSFFIIGFVLSWNIGKEETRIAEQQRIQQTLKQEQVDLQAKRDKLIAKSRLVALGGVQLNLHLPKKEQEHYLY